ncbi:MAG: hypothetical protein LRS48_01160 [Desulfurococcales archaeon]|nr:hypothetical protein [Desulfurococcales archaeon]
MRNRAGSLGSLLLLLLFLAGLVGGGRICSGIALVTAFLPQAIVASYIIVSVRDRDLVTAIAAIVMLLEIAFLVYFHVRA